MTVYYAKPYMVGGSYAHGGDREVEFDPMPADLKKVWEIEPADPNETTPWVRGADDVWTVEGEGDEGLALEWEELLDEFGPLTDDESQAGMGLDALQAENDRAAYAADLAAWGGAV